ncbi:MAG TPA: polyketide synthase, partial [Polyangiales bacterium]|nr:polyketide synthase [Polyangiales bacterium]
IAPSIAGQERAIVAAQTMCSVDSRSISYIEAHGTATQLGDPVEVHALSAAFRRHTADNGFCALGSVKSNIGHTSAAAGVAGVIKTSLALHKRTLPASLHFKEPNPLLELHSSPFYVVDSTRPWLGDGDQPLRAGVSAFGVGGANAHIIMEEFR